MYAWNKFNSIFEIIMDKDVALKIISNVFDSFIIWLDQSKITIGLVKNWKNIFLIFWCIGLLLQVKVRD